MTSENTSMDAFLKRTVVDHILNHYGEKLAKLFIGQRIQDLIEGLGDDVLTDLATGDVPVHRLIKTLPEPETKSVFYRMFELYPNLADVYPNIDAFNLPQNQLERLARGDNPIEVLGKPEGFYLTPPFNPPRIHNSHLTDGSPRTAYTNGCGERKISPNLKRGF